MKTGLAFSLFSVVVFTACASSANQQGGVDDILRDKRRKR
jgi:hypothetical protein